MPDQTITQAPLADGRISYALGQPNWESRRIPNIRRPAETVQIDEDRMIDVIVLGDGFTKASDFRDALVVWLANFYDITVYDRFAGCLRIRALYTPSAVPASPSRNSYYRCLIRDDGKSIATNIEEDGPYWWKADDADGVAFREAFWDSVDLFDDASQRRYPLDLDVGSSNQAITNDLLRDMYRNVVVSLLVRTADLELPSGRAIEVARPEPDQSRHMHVAVGANEIHEFGHAFGHVGDEYINGRGTPETLTRVDPATPSVFSMSNLRYSNRVDDVPWIHLSPGGWRTRTASGVDPSPVVGWLWVGGGVHRGVWHAEYQCLMNGSHDNFQFTQIAADDPTANTDGTFTDENGADLRDRDRLCLWCQELVTLRILEKTDQLLEAGDPNDVTAQGIEWYARWVDGLRSKYYVLFDVAAQIADTEARYAAMKPGASGEALWRSDLYAVPTASPASPGSPAPAVSDDELFLLTTVAAIP